MFYTTPHFSIYFGDASDNLYQQEYLSYSGNTPLPAREPYAGVCKALGVQEVTFCHQVHSTTGYTATRAPTVYPQPFCAQGDYLVTNQPIALGVMTADCLPIALYDQKTGACGMVHAGWRGTAAGIIEQAIAHMERDFGSQCGDVQAILGPAARACCYEVTPEFKEPFQKYASHDDLFTVRNGALFFDLSACAERLLQECGVDKKAIVTDFNECTICNTRYCSYRRDKERAGRQMSILAPRDQMSIIASRV